MASTEGVRAHNCLAFIGPGPTLGLDHSHSCVDMVHMQTIVPSLPVERVGNYQVLEKLGAGGMGVVYKAVDLKLDRTVALKFLSQEGFEAPDREQLLREARAASALDHANIGTVYGVEDTDDGRLCIVMAFYDGETLAQKMRRGALSRERAINIACQVARGLHHAHLHGVIHRDIKPSNVMVTSDGIAKIVDFGLARRFTPSATTQSGGASGTLLYMAPEQAMAKPVDARADIWSLGVMLYQMLTGRLPFAGENAAATLMGILHDPPAPVDELPEELQLIVYRALAKSPVARYQNCAELLREIEKLAPSDRERTTSISRTELHGMLRAASWAAGPFRHMPRMAWLIVALMVVLVTVTSAILLAGYFSRRDHRTAARAQAAINPAILDNYRMGEKLSTGSHDQRRSARKYFEKAIALDPSYAPAYAGLADYYWAMAEMDPREAMPAARQNAMKALQLDPRLAKAHKTLASIYFYADFNWHGADEEYGKALNLDPDFAEGHSMYSVFLAAMGRFDESVMHARRFQTLDSTSARARMIVGWDLYYSRRFQEAIVECNSVFEMEPNNPNAYECLGVSYLALGNGTDAVKACMRAVDLNPEAAKQVCLARTYASTHKPGEARRIISRLMTEKKTGYVPAVYLARIYAALGQKDEAFSWLDQAYNERDRYLVWLKVDEALDSLRSDPRFDALLRRVQLPR